MEPINLPKLLLDLELDCIIKAVAASRSHAAAARLLGINRTTLVQKMKRFGLPVGFPSNPTKRAEMVKAMNPLADFYKRPKTET